MTTLPLTYLNKSDPKFKLTIRKRLTIKSAAIVKASFFSELLSCRKLFRIYYMHG
jgi:hypothetical protein